MGQKPKIRFKGFTDNWEQHRLGDISKTTIGEFVIKSKQNDSFPYPVFNGGSSNTGFYNEFNNEGNKILVSARGNAGFVNIIKSRYWAGNSCYSIDILNKNQYDTDFIYQEMKRNQSRFTENQQTATIPSVSKADVEKFIVDVPTYKEQLKIADLFVHLDSLIAFHQCKYDSLTKYKESMLQKLFPMRGKKEPEIRFKGFSVPWTEYKLGELYTERNERGNNSLQILSVSIHSGVSDGELDEGELGKAVKRSEDKSTYKHVYTGDLIFNMMRAWEGAIGVAKCEGMISPAYISAVPNEKVYPLFMDYALRRSETIAEINNLSYGIRDFRKRLYGPHLFM